MLLTSAAVPLPLKEAITVELCLRYADSIFAVGLHTSERNPISDITPPLTRTPSSSAAGSSQILLPQGFSLASHGNVPDGNILPIEDSNSITTEE